MVHGMEPAASLLLVLLSAGVLRVSDALPHDDPVVVTTENAALVPPSLPSAIDITIGGLQIDARDPTKLLIGLYDSSRPAVQAGAIGTLAINNLGAPVTVLYGDLTKPKPADGVYTDAVGTAAEIRAPQYLYQTKDNNRILFVDKESCAREIDRTTNLVKTVIGVGNCGNWSLDISASISGVQPQLVNGMTYDDDRKMWVFSVVTQGVYVYTYNPGSGTYSGRVLVPSSQMSVTVSITLRQLHRSGEILWHKVRSGINMYNVTNLSRRGVGAVALNTSFFRYLSSASLADPTALYQYTDSNLKLGTTDADLSVAPDNRTLMIADKTYDRLFFLDIASGNLSVLCTKNPTLRDGDAASCTFYRVACAVWEDDKNIIVYEEKVKRFRRVRFVPVTTTTPSTTTTIPPSTTSDISTTSTSLPSTTSDPSTMSSTAASTSFNPGTTTAPSIMSSSSKMATSAAQKSLSSTPADSEGAILTALLFVVVGLMGLIFIILVVHLCLRYGPCKQLKSKTDQKSNDLDTQRKRHSYRNVDDGVGGGSHPNNRSGDPLPGMWAIRTVPKIPMLHKAKEVNTAEIPKQRPWRS